MWIICTPHTERKGSMYFTLINPETLEAMFTGHIDQAKKYETATLAKAAIKDNDLTNSHVIPY